VIVADTGAVVALLDRRDRHHAVLRALFEEAPDQWVLPWAILPEVDYLAGSQLGPNVRDGFFKDVAEGLYQVEIVTHKDLVAAERLHARHRALSLGLVDACVMAVTERVRARAVATLDIRHFGAVALRGAPKLLPRDL
jgi:predicted nucleic acid-binding protein